LELPLLIPIVNVPAPGAAVKNGIGTPPAVPPYD